MRRASAKLAAAGVALLLATAAAVPVLAQENWPQVKCDRYKKATAEALARIGTKGLSRAFLDEHEAFLASNCATAPNVCPRSPEELNLANILVVAGMNAGMASTFMPFACRRGT